MWCPKVGSGYGVSIGVILSPGRVFCSKWLTIRGQSSLTIRRRRIIKKAEKVRGNLKALPPKEPKIVNETGYHSHRCLDIVIVQYQRTTVMSPLRHPFVFCVCLSDLRPYLRSRRIVKVSGEDPLGICRLLHIRYNHRLNAPVPLRHIKREGKLLRTLPDVL